MAHHEGRPVTQHSASSDQLLRLLRKGVSSPLASSLVAGAGFPTLTEYRKSFSASGRGSTSNSASAGRKNAQAASQNTRMGVGPLESSPPPFQTLLLDQVSHPGPSLLSLDESKPVSGLVSFSPRAQTPSSRRSAAAFLNASSPSTQPGWNQPMRPPPKTANSNRLVFIGRAHLTIRPNDL